MQMMRACPKLCWTRLFKTTARCSFATTNDTQNHENLDSKLVQKETILKLSSRRLDAILKRTSGIGTNSFEKSLASGCVRVNEQVEKKKAYNVNEGDEIEMWLAPVTDNPELARVHHVDIIEYQLKEHNYDILVSVDKSYLVKNWRHRN